jgi:ATP synthase protein I
MYKTVSLQLGMALVAMMIAGALAGMRGAISAGLAGLVCVVPNLWFALHLNMASGTRKPLAVRFFVGEFVKVAASCALLLAAACLYPQMHWPSFVLGMVVVLQSCLLALWKRY